MSDFVFGRGTDVVSFIVVVSTPFGPIALTADDLENARTTAEELLPKDTVASKKLTSPTSLIDATQAELLFGVPASWFLQQARERKINSYRFGRYVRFDPEELKSVTEVKRW